MTNQMKKLLDEALSLSDSERALLAATLIDSLEPQNEAEVENAWETEFNKRLRQIDSGTSTIPWTEARKQILEGLG